MCYSILVETNLKKLERDFRAAIDFSSFEQAYRIRAHNLENIKIPKGVDRAIAESNHPRARVCQMLTEQYEADQHTALKAKVAEQQGKVLQLETKLQQRWSKTNQQLLDRAKRVQQKAEQDVTRLLAPATGAHGESQVFQYSYCPVITSRSGQNIVRLMRYQLRPRHAAGDAPSKINMFNARRDALLTRPSWKPLFGQNHGLVLLSGFYEWVPHPDTGKSAVIRFSPDDGSPMWVPCLFDRWQGADYTLESFAVITDEPPKDIEERGHDRCPVYPSWQYIDSWLAGGSIAGSDKILASREAVRYRGTFVAKKQKPSDG